VVDPERETIRSGRARTVTVPCESCTSTGKAGGASVVVVVASVVVVGGSVVVVMASVVAVGGSVVVVGALVVAVGACVVVAGADVVVGATVATVVGAVSAVVSAGSSPAQAPNRRADNARIASHFPPVRRVFTYINILL